jgi:hypothetical protein
MRLLQLAQREFSMTLVAQITSTLKWLLSQSPENMRDNAMAIYNCAIRLRLEVLNADAWSLPDSDRVRKRLLKRVDALSSTALRVHLNARDASARRPGLMANLIKRGQSVVECVRDVGIPLTQKHDQSFWLPPSIKEVATAISKLTVEPDIVPALPEEYVKSIAGGVQDILAGATYEGSTGGNRSIATSMNNTGAAAIKLAQRDHASASIPSAMRQHDRLSAEIIIRRPS